MKQVNNIEEYKKIIDNIKVNNCIRQLIPRLYKRPEKCYNNHKVQRSPRKSRDLVEQDGS